MKPRLYRRPPTADCRPPRKPRLYRRLPTADRRPARRRPARRRPPRPLAILAILSAAALAQSRADLDARKPYVDQARASINQISDTPRVAWLAFLAHQETFIDPVHAVTDANQAFDLALSLPATNQDLIAIKTQAEIESMGVVFTSAGYAAGLALARRADASQLLVLSQAARICMTYRPFDDGEVLRLIRDIQKVGGVYPYREMATFIREMHSNDPWSLPNAPTVRQALIDEYLANASREKDGTQLGIAAASAMVSGFFQASPAGRTTLEAMLQNLTALSPPPPSAGATAAFLLAELDRLDPAAARDWKAKLPAFPAYRGPINTALMANFNPEADFLAARAREPVLRSVDSALALAAAKVPSLNQDLAALTPAQLDLRLAATPQWKPTDPAAVLLAIYTTAAQFDFPKTWAAVSALDSPCKPLLQARVAATFPQDSEGN